MAYTSVIPVRRLDRTVDYVQNKEKTTPKSLEEAVDYAANRDKTESTCFETGLGCTTTSAFEDMRLNTLRWHKETGVQGYHLVQSFAEGEVTPELAHQIGVEFAEQLFLGKYQAIVTTHLNTKHYHNHIVWSAVSLEDGKKYHSNSKSYYTEVRALSDVLCQKYGLSIIETPESLRGKRQYEKWRAEENNQPTWRTAIRQDVDEAIRQSLTWRQFLGALERKGYEVRMGRKYPVLRPPEKERFVRFKTLGKRYTPEAIQTRILYPRSYRPYVENPPTIQCGRLRGNGKPRRKLPGCGRCTTVTCTSWVPSLASHAVPAMPCGRMPTSWISAFVRWSFYPETILTRWSSWKLTDKPCKRKLGSCRQSVSNYPKPMMYNRNVNRSTQP